MLRFRFQVMAEMNYFADIPGTRLMQAYGRNFFSCVSTSASVKSVLDKFVN